MGVIFKIDTINNSHHFLLQKKYTMGIDFACFSPYFRTFGLGIITNPPPPPDKQIYPDVLLLYTYNHLILTSKPSLIIVTFNSIWKDRGIRKQLNMKFVKVLIWPVITYGAEGWTLRKMMKDD